MEKFKTGDLVRFVDGGTESRIGLVISRVYSLLHYTSPEPEETDLYEILLSNGSKVSIHKMYLVRVSE